MAEESDHREAEVLRPDFNKNNDIENCTRANADNQKWRLIMEPVLISSILAINLAQTSIQNFYLRTACNVDLGFPKNVCDSGVGPEFRIVEEASQEVVSNVLIGRGFVSCLITTVVLLFVGPWSDCSGRRKPLIILPLVGMCVMSTSLLLLLTFPGASTLTVIYAVQIPMSLGGNFGLLLAAAFSHIGDICHSTGRDVTRTMGTHRAATQAAQMLGALSGPYMFHHFGFYGVFLVVLTLQLLCLTYVIFVMKDVNINKDNKVSVFNWRLPMAAVTCLIRKREGHRRKMILFMMFIALIDRIIFYADILLSYMYYRRKFYWDDMIFGFFNAYRNLVSFFGTLLILSVLKRAMRLSDECVGMLSCFSYVLSVSGLIAARTSAIVFVLPLVGIIAQGSQVVLRPILNKQILPTEQGKIYSITGALESATQLIFAPLYSLLYSKTVMSHPDAWLYPGIVFAILQLFSYYIIKYYRIITHRNEKSHLVKSVALKTIISRDEQKLDENKELKEDKNDEVHEKEINNLIPK